MSDDSQCAVDALTAYAHIVTTGRELALHERGHVDTGLNVDPGACHRIGQTGIGAEGLGCLNHREVVVDDELERIAERMVDTVLDLAVPTPRPRPPRLPPLVQPPATTQLDRRQTTNQPRLTGP